MNPTDLPAIFQQTENLNIQAKHLEMLKKDAEEMALFHFERNQKLAALLLAINSHNTIDRKMWQLIRESLFWEVEVPSYPEKKFKEDFRMCRNTFRELVETVKFLEKEDTTFRESIPVDKRVAISLYYLSSSVECRTISNLFGIGRSTVREIVLEFCNAVCSKHENNTFVNYPPTEKKIKELTAGFEERWRFPQIYGAVDGCHIEVCPRKDEATDYHNYKGWYSIVLLAVVDYRYRFTYINVGSPGRNNDSYVFEKSKLKLQHERNQLFYKHSRVINGVAVPVVLLGDSAFKLSPYMMKPYPGNNLNPTQKHFNYMLSRSRRVVENAFGQLKGRFRTIGCGIELISENACLVIKTCYIFHNYLNNRNDNLGSIVEEEQTNFTINQPSHKTRQEDNKNAIAIRNSLATYLFSGWREIVVTDDEDVLEQADEGASEITGASVSTLDDREELPGSS